jgi:hypothetical protein
MKTSFFQKAAGSIALLGIIILLSGCPFSGSVPIDEGTVPIPGKMLGTWIKVSDTSEANPTTFSITLEDKYHAEVSKFEPGTEDTEDHLTYYRVSLSDVDGDIFMNVQENGSTSYYYYKYTYDANNDQMNLYEVSDYIKETFDTSKSLKGFIAKNKSLSFFFTNTTDTYLRQKKQE